MHILDHISITVRDLDAAKPFYRAIMHALGIDQVYERDDAIGFGERNLSDNDEHSYLSIYRSAQAVPDRRRHWCLRASSIEAVQRFHDVGLEHGGRDAGSPGLRPHYHAGYYAAFLEDCEGNRIEAVHHLPRNDS